MSDRYLDLREVTNMSGENNHPRWIIGSLAIYAPTLAVANTVYDIVVPYIHEETFGTVFFENGDEIDWFDMSFDAMRHGNLH
ncbi:hypothetical protein [Noviherbaspirillum agri]